MKFALYTQIKKCFKCTKILLQRHDKPRWGDYPDKLELSYIAGLIETGGWFDGGHPFIRVDRAQTPAHLYAPAFFLDNEERFSHLLVPPQHRTRNRTHT